jgi:hypothetical protein
VRATGCGYITDAHVRTPPVDARAVLASLGVARVPYDVAAAICASCTIAAVVLREVRLDGEEHAHSRTGGEGAARTDGRTAVCATVRHSASVDARVYGAECPREVRRA